MKKQQYWKLMLWIFLLYYIYTGAIILYYQNNTSEDADAALVLGATVNGSEPSTIFKERIKHGIYLYKTGRVKKLIFSGGKANTQNQAEAIVGKQYALTNEIPEIDILIEPKASSTLENMQFSKAIMQENDKKSVLIVSDRLHLKRAMLMAKDQGIIGFPAPIPNTKYKSIGSQLIFLFLEIPKYQLYQISKIIQ